MKGILEQETNKMSNKLKTFYILIILVCIIAIIAAVIIQVKIDKEGTENKLPTIGEEDLESYKTEFNNIFQNKVNYLENNKYKITKIEQEKEIVYVGYENEESKINNYELDVSIPYINIRNDVTEKFNEQIVDTFEKKAKSILNNNNNTGSAIYTVNYSAYVTNNILSLVIRSTLKEGNNPQRDIIQTYNYDLINQKEYTMEDILDKKGITKRQANEKIKEEIKKVEKRVQELSLLGYNVFPRDSEDDMYSINNVTEYFIGENDALYIIFAYGNENNTSEMDIIIM